MIQWPLERCGVYFLFDGDELDYIGSSTDLGHRISDHLRQQFGWMITAVFVLPCDPTDRLHLENAFIRVFKPHNNIKMKYRKEDEAIVDKYELPELLKKWRGDMVRP